MSLISESNEKIQFTNTYFWTKKKRRKTSHMLYMKHHISKIRFLLYCQALSVIFINMKKKEDVLTLYSHIQTNCSRRFSCCFFSSSLNNRLSSTCRYICYSTLFSKSKWTCFITSITLMCSLYVLCTRI